MGAEAFLAPFIRWVAFADPVGMLIFWALRKVQECIKEEKRTLEYNFIFQYTRSTEQHLKGD